VLDGRQLHQILADRPWTFAWSGPERARFRFGRAKVDEGERAGGCCRLHGRAEADLVTAREGAFRPWRPPACSSAAGARSRPPPHGRPWRRAEEACHRTAGGPSSLPAQAEGSEVELGRKTWLMGVLNVTPDSFFDGGAYFDPDAAVTHGSRPVRGRSGHRGRGWRVHATGRRRGRGSRRGVPPGRACHRAPARTGSRPALDRHDEGRRGARGPRRGRGHRERRQRFPLRPGHGAPRRGAGRARRGHASQGDFASMHREPRYADVSTRWRRSSARPSSAARRRAFQRPA
jgi:hypothetical protein